MKTQSINTANANREWVLVDAADQTVGRLASRIAAILRGKHKATFSPNADTGDFVVVINSEKIKLSGKKWQDKVYRSHSGYFGGLKEITAEKLHEKDPTAILSIAVQGMIPRGPLGRKVFTKLKVYAGTDHPHVAQNPRSIDISKF